VGRQGSADADDIISAPLQRRPPATATKSHACQVEANMADLTVGSVEIRPIASGEDGPGRMPKSSLGGLHRAGPLGRIDLTRRLRRGYAPATPAHPWRPRAAAFAHGRGRGRGVLGCR